MLGDLAELFRGEPAGLMENRLPGADLSDVVQLATQADALERGALEAHPPSGGDRVAGDPDGMTSGVGVLGLEGSCKHLHSLEEELLDALGLVVNPTLQVFLVVAILQDQGA